MKKQTITIVGNGNIANLFGQRFVDVGIEINSISTRNEQEGINLAKKLNAKFEKLNQITSEIIFVCVSDDAISSICNNIPKEKTIIYASGVIPLKQIKQANAGVFYPLQTISKNSLNSPTGSIKSLKKGLLKSVINMFCPAFSDRCWKASSSNMTSVDELS